MSQNCQSAKLLHNPAQATKQHITHVVEPNLQASPALVVLGDGLVELSVPTACQFCNYYDDILVEVELTSEQHVQWRPFPSLERPCGGRMRVERSDGRESRKDHDGVKG